MECRDYEGRLGSMARVPCAVALELGTERGVGRARKPARPVVLPPHAACDPARYPPPDVPFMNDMDEISYWIHTKRAPCLMNYDNIIKKQNEEARCTKVDIKTVIETEPSPQKKKKKRKLSLLDEDSVSSGKQQNIYFEVSQKHNNSQRPLLNDCKSDSMGSDIDFNIKNTSVGEKPKRVRLQKSNQTRIHKKNNVVTSTPKTTVNLRRSLRQAQLNNSLDIFNTSGTNGALVKHVVNSDQKPDKVNKTEILAAGDQSTTNKRHSTQRNKSKNVTHMNGQYEDYSDVSGFTANYIRSTKVQSSKTPRKLRCKTRNIAKETQQSSQNDSNMIVCMNKSVNTGLPEPNMLNCSTDSSQNVINLISTKNNINPIKLDKSTSLLKFMDTRTKSKERASKDKQKSKTNLNVSFQSQSSGQSRYPKRLRSQRDTSISEAHHMDTRLRSNKNCLQFNNSDKKENPQEKVVSRTRSGRNVAQQRENSVLVVSNSTERVSSRASMNVASPPLVKQRKKRRPARQARPKKTVNRSGVKDSLRDKSGFTACFSESDDDSVPLVQRKYFCN